MARVQDDVDEGGGGKVAEHGVQVVVGDEGRQIPLVAVLAHVVGDEGLVGHIVFVARVVRHLGAMRRQGEDQVIRFAGFDSGHGLAEPADDGLASRVPINKQAHVRLPEPVGAQQQVAEFLRIVDASVQPAGLGQVGEFIDAHAQGDLAGAEGPGVRRGRRFRGSVGSRTDGGWGKGRP